MLGIGIVPWVHRAFVLFSSFSSYYIRIITFLLRVMRNRIAIYLLCILCNLLFGFVFIDFYYWWIGTRSIWWKWKYQWKESYSVSYIISRSNSFSYVFLILFITVGMMMYIVDMYKDRYTIYIGMFDSGICCLHENLSKYEVLLSIALLLDRAFR